LIRVFVVSSKQPRVATKKGSGAEGQDKADPDPGSAEKIRPVVAAMRRAIHPFSENNQRL